MRNDRPTPKDVYRALHGTGATPTEAKTTKPKSAKEPAPTE
jgi:hypothetical protein